MKLFMLIASGLTLLLLGACRFDHQTSDVAAAEPIAVAPPLMNAHDKWPGRSEIEWGKNRPVMEKYLVAESGDLRSNGDSVISREAQLHRNQAMQRIHRLVEEPGIKFKKNWQLDIWYDDGKDEKNCWKMSLSGLNGGESFTIESIGTPEKAACD